MVKELSKFVIHLAKLKTKDLKRRYLYQYFPKKPVVINLNANDICNSKCTMCNIWKQKQGFEFSPEDLARILKDPLYSDIQHIGITGGEPTLREDLPQLYEACAKSLPSLKGLSIITNAIKEKDVIKRVTEVIEVCKKHNKSFSMMVSLDGYGSMHDHIRGRENNWQTAINVINHFSKNSDIPVATGSTISKDNVYDIDELLEYMIENGIYGRFRVAEYIKRLYNDDRNDVIRNYTDDELYALQCFFHKVEHTFETNPVYKRTYKSIQSVLGGGKRTIGCPYQAEGVVLDSKADLHYCAPKSEIIGNAIQTPSIDLFQDNLEERKSLLSSKCDDCIHDYHYPVTYNEEVTAFKEKHFRSLIHLDTRYSRKKYYLLLGHLQLAKLRSKNQALPIGLKVLIVGWYGTETVGDKAILGGIMANYRKDHPGVTFVVGSLNPFITVRTRQEMNERFEVIDVYSSAFFDAIVSCQHIVMGGGPLMDIDELAVALLGFRLAKTMGKERVIAGCGIGPLFHDRYESAVKEMLALATQISVRDTKSQQKAMDWTGRQDIPMTGDPSLVYLRSLRFDQDLPKKREIACFLREWPTEYNMDIEPAVFEKKRQQFEDKLAKSILDLALSNGCTIKLYSMHTFWVGGDDRIYYRAFIKKHFADYPDLISYEKTPSSVDQITKAMKQSFLNITMRFHSVVFAHTLDTPFIAIDYTNGGKIFQFLKDNQASSHYISPQQIAESTTALSNVASTVLV